jgi:predicted small metal-binding protein
MAQQVKCECGYVARAESDDEVVAKIQEHIRSDHPDLVGKVTEEHIRGWIEVVG